MLSQQQIQDFHEQGVLVVPNVVSAQELAGMTEDLAAWVEESRGHAQAWGQTQDGRARFDIESDHSATHPSLRRISSPTEISGHYFQVAMHSRMTEMAGELIGGKGIRFHHSKLNAKLPHTATQVKWHQDFPFTPHTNDDLVTALLMLTDVSAENGPLMVIPGSHRGTLFSHWQQGRFTGQVEEEVIAQYCGAPMSCTGRAGSVCFMHTRLLHASGPNTTTLPRNMFITVYKAEDAQALCENPLPSQHENQLVFGVESGLVRMTPNSLKLPQKPAGASFFVQQAGLDTAMM